MKGKVLTGCFSALGLMLLILDTKTALSGASEGISLCMQTVIPSLFPFILLSLLLTSTMTAIKLPFGKGISKVLKIPENALPLFFIGLLSGYPAGAQNVAIACKRGEISKEDAERLAAICNNAGPAFLFGMGITVLEEMWIVFVLWGIQILSSILLAVLTPRQGQSNGKFTGSEPMTIWQGMKQSVQTMASVCGWVVLFRIVISFLERWLLWALPADYRILICGSLELANGCCRLVQLQSLGARLLHFSFFCGFGGLCVTLQTLSVTSQINLPAKKYLPAKLAQGAICLLLANAAQLMLQPEHRQMLPIPVVVIALAICLFYWLTSKKVVAFRKNMMYNNQKQELEGTFYAVS